MTAALSSAFVAMPDRAQATVLKKELLQRGLTCTVVLTSKDSDVFVDIAKYSYDLAFISVRSPPGWLRPGQTRFPDLRARSRY